MICGFVSKMMAKALHPMLWKLWFPQLWAPNGQQMGGKGEPSHSPSRHAALFGDAVLWQKWMNCWLYGDHNRRWGKFQLFSDELKSLRQLKSD